MKTVLTKAENNPETECELLIAFDNDGTLEFVSGWYDLNEQEYYQYDGELIEFDNVHGWTWKPEIIFE